MILRSIATRYIIVQYSTSAISLTLCGTVAYLVMFHSPKKMGKYKFYVLNSTIADILYEVFCYLLFQPVPLFPSYSGICLGWLSHLGRNFCYYGFIGYILIFGYMLYSLTISFFYRYRILSPISVKKYLENKLTIPILIAFGLLMVSLPSLALVFSQDTDYAKVRNQTVQIWPMYAEEIDEFVLFGASDNIWIYMFIGLLAVLLLGQSLVAVLLAVLINMALRKQAHIMSKQTQNMHRTLSNILLAQILLPIIFVLIPVLICCSFVVFNYANKDLIWVSLTPLTLYPILSNLIFLYFSKPHREALVKLIKVYVLRRKDNGIQIVVHSPASAMMHNSVIT